MWTTFDKMFPRNRLAISYRTLFWSKVDVEDSTNRSYKCKICGVSRKLNSSGYTTTLTSRVVLLAHYFINNPNNQEIEIYDEEEIKNYDEELYIRVKLFKDVLLKLLENQERARKLRNEQKERARRLRNEQNQKRVVVSGCSIGKPYLKILNNIRLS